MEVAALVATILNLVAAIIMIWQNRNREPPRGRHRR